VTEHAYRIAIDVYRLTATFPDEERFGLTQQMRRAAVSIGSNISEGCGRRGDKELLHSLYIAVAEAKELAYQLRVSDGLEFGPQQERQRLRGDVDRLERMLNRLTSYLRAQTAKGMTKGAPRSERPTNARTHQPTL
jgi:four helix bundle protein